MKTAIERRARITAAVLACAAWAAMTGGALAAGVPASLAKLEGSSESSASDAMRHAGYEQSSSKENWNRKDSFWWSAKARQCLRLTSRFGFVSGVALVGPGDCAAVGNGVGPGRPGRLTASDLLGLSRQGGETKLAEAGFNAIWIDEGKPDGIPMLWFNQRTGQCIAATVVGNKFDLARDEPTSKCR